jgi:radical SAM protein with 4Fe4S-binding SPASM domain
MALYVSWRYVHCPYCGEEIPKGEFHLCNRSAIMPVSAEAMARLQKLKQSIREEMEEKYKQAMRDSIEHLKKCSTCKYLSKIDGGVCVDMRKLRAEREKLLIEKEIH